jgi:DNA-binding GntR family transcriptional regulator
MVGLEMQRPAPRWLAIANQISDQITTGQLRPGDRLPSTAQLCTTHQVSTIVIRNVMIRLKAQGLIDAVPGVGTFVAEAAPTR